jgi:iron complex outermembrane recepter protein
MNKKCTILLLMLGVSSASMITMASSANAQTAQTASADDINLEEIIVTATRRNSSLQDVPLSISALSTDKITTLGIRSSNDIAAITPGLSFVDGGDGGQQLTVRGIVAVGGQATTAFYVDETPIAQRLGTTYTPRYFDIERVEVLRGPQGTLYGASSMGGAVRLITAKPNLTQFEGGIRAEGSTTRFASANYVVDGALSIPLVSDKLALRINGFYEKQSGWIKRFRPDYSDDPAAYFAFDDEGNIVGAGVPLTAVLDSTGKRTGDQKIFGGRAALRFDPTDTISLTASYAYQERRNEGFNTSDTAAGLGFAKGDLVQLRSFDELRIAKTHLANFTAQVDFGFAKLTSSSSYQLDPQRNVTDFSSAFLQNVVGNFGFIPKANGVAGVNVLNSFRTKDYTQELRLVSAGDSALNWIVGGFFNDSSSRQDQNFRSLGIEAIVGPAAPGDNIITAFYTQKLREISVFGELGYKFSDTLSATVGLRRYDISVNFQSKLAVIGLPEKDSGQLAPPKENGFTYKAVLTYKPNNDLLFFGGVTSGYRPGSTNELSTSDFVIPLRYTTDKLTQFELGWKTSWLDRKARFNGSLFYIDWTDIPIGLISPDKISYTINGPKARNYGAEFEFELRPVKGLSLSTGITLLNVKFGEDYLDAESGIEIKKGDRLSTIPSYGVNAAIGYEWAINDNIKARLNADVSHVSKRAQTQAASVKDSALEIENTLPGSVIAGLSAGLSFDTFDISIFARNIFDERALTSNNVLGTEILDGTAIDQRRFSYSQPRTIGASFSYKF